VGGDCLNVIVDDVATSRYLKIVEPGVLELGQPGNVA
jgi:hypothetical protein